MRALLHYRASPGFRERLAALRSDWLEVATVTEDDHDGFATAMRDTDVLLHVLEPVRAEHIAAAPHLKLIQKIGVGVNTIDLDAARAHGVAVCNMPGTNTRAVAEMTLYLMLAALRRGPWLHDLTRSGRWTPDPAGADALGELGGRTVGLVGHGAVARALRPVLQALGARVLVCSRSRDTSPGVEWRDLDALLAEADVLSLHLPLSDETHHLIDADALARMRPGAVLVNTARGPLVDETALAEALASGHLRAAGLDVFDTEPVAADSPLLALPNVVLAPHMAWLTGETLQRSLAVAAENCRRLRDGEALLHRVA